MGFYTGQIDPICIVRNPFPYKYGVGIKGIAGLYPDVQSKEKGYRWGYPTQESMLSKHLKYNIYSPPRAIYDYT